MAFTGTFGSASGAKYSTLAMVISLQESHHCFLLVIYSNVSQTVCPRRTGAPWTICRCAASLFKVLYVDRNFLPKSKKCCHKVMVNNCCKSRVALQITAREIMTFFGRSASFRAESSDFQRFLLREVAISKKKRSSPFPLSPVIPIGVNWNRFAWLMCREICLVNFLCRQTKKFGNHYLQQ